MRILPGQLNLRSQDAGKGNTKQAIAEGDLTVNVRCYLTERSTESEIVSLHKSARGKSYNNSGTVIMKVVENRPENSKIREGTL